MTQWLGSQRGIHPQTLDEYGITTDEQGNVVYPYSNAVKKRANLTRPDKERKIWWQPALGKGQIDMFGPDQPGKRTYFLVEGESDAMRLHQELQLAGKLDDAGVFGLSGVNTWRPENVAKLDGATTVYVVLDNDDPYENPLAVQSVEGAWPQMRRDLGKRAVRVKLPRGVKDLCEFFDAYDLEAFKVLLANTPRVQWQFQAVDFSQPPPPRDWLLDQIIHWKTFGLIIGEPGAGKSFFTMGLAVALAEGWSHFLGMPLHHHGPVLYFDDENPDDIVRNRMAQLGLTEKGWANMRYVSNQGIDVMENWDQVRAEALELEPVAIFFDSLAEISSAEENSKTEMKETMSRLKSLSREMDTTVVVIHHTDKDKGRARGSGHIRATTDFEWFLGESEHDQTQLRLVAKKHRHGIRRGTTHMFTLEDEREGDKLITTLRPTGGKEPF